MNIEDCNTRRQDWLNSEMPKVWGKWLQWIDETTSEEKELGRAEPDIFTHTKEFLNTPEFEATSEMLTGGKHPLVTDDN